MSSALVKMQAVFLQYWTDGVKTMIYASDTLEDPTDKYRTNGTPSKGLVNEVLGKITAKNNNPSKSIQLQIEDNVYIVPDPTWPVGAGAMGMRAARVGSPAVPMADAAEAAEAAADGHHASAARKKVAPKRAPTDSRHARKRSSGKAASKKKASPKKAKTPRAKPKKKRKP